MGGEGPECACLPVGAAGEGAGPCQREVTDRGSDKMTFPISAVVIQSITFQNLLDQI